MSIQDSFTAFYRVSFSDRTFHRQGAVPSFLSFTEFPFSFAGHFKMKRKNKVRVLFRGSPDDSPSITEFGAVAPKPAVRVTEFSYRVSIGGRVFLSVFFFYWVFTGFYWVLLGFTEFYRVLLGFTGFHWVL